MTPKEECEVLLEALLSSSKNLLKKNGEFYPIGAVMKNDGTVTFTSAYFGNEFPESQSVINGLISAHRQLAQNGEIKTSGIAWNGTVSSGEKQIDAIIVSLEHKDEYSVVVGLPYKAGLFKSVKFGELFANKGKNDIF